MNVEAIQEGEVSKRRRDWAFTERDKIVLQRETLKTMYEQLRKERDRDKINLAEALRDTDELKRQLSGAVKELQVVKQVFANENSDDFERVLINALILGKKLNRTRETDCYS